MRSGQLSVLEICHSMARSQLRSTFDKTIGVRDIRPTAQHDEKRCGPAHGMELHATHVAGEVGLAVNADPTEAMDTGMARGCATGQTRLRQIFRTSRSHHRDPAMHCPVSSGQWREDRIGVRPRGAVAPRANPRKVEPPAITEASPRANQGPHRAWKGCPGSRPWGKAGAPLQTPGPQSFIAAIVCQQASDMGGKRHPRGRRQQRLVRRRPIAPLKLMEVTPPQISSLASLAKELEPNMTKKLHMQMTHAHPSLPTQRMNKHAPHQHIIQKQNMRQHDGFN